MYIEMWVLYGPRGAIKQQTICHGFLPMGPLRDTNVLHVTLYCNSILKFGDMP